MIYAIDFETYSNVDIKLHGMYNYAADPSTYILCMGYREAETVEALLTTQTQLWFPGTTSFPSGINSAKAIYAMNAEFEYQITKRAGGGFFQGIPRECFVDVAALAARLKFPLNLKALSVACQATVLKDSAGPELIRKCCTPSGKPTEEDFKNLYKYCVQDVDTMCEDIAFMPMNTLPPREQATWVITQEMNEAGVQIDVTAVKAITSYLDEYIETEVSQLPIITGGAVNTAGQIKKILGYCAEQGVSLPNLQVATVTEYLGREDLPDSVRRVLSIRQAVGLSSVKKFKTLLDLQNGGYVQGNLVYHGAGTGRWAGRGFQFHNLPRAKVENPDELIEKFINKEKIDSPVKAAKALIRPMIKTPEDEVLMVADYSAIEYVLLCWLAGEDEALDRIRKGFCQYKDMAADIYNIPYDEVTKNQRAEGKADILGCGYQMGPTRFQVTAQSNGMDITLGRATFLVKAYRRKFKRIVDMWYAFDRAVKTAIKFPGVATKTHRCTFKKVGDWLIMALPSKRNIYYYKPAISEGRYGMVASYTRQSSKNFQMERVDLSPGLITENIVQAIARDILVDAKTAIRDEMPECVMRISVHDELGVTTKKEGAEEKFEKFIEILSRPPSWAKELPLSCAGYISNRYKKD